MSDEELQNRRIAVQCVARMFSGKGHMIIDESCTDFGGDKTGAFDDYEKKLLKDFFDFFLSLIEGRDYETESQ